MGLSPSSEFVKKNRKPQKKRDPSAKQLRAAKFMSENLRKDKPDTKGQILLKAGYSEEISKKPSVIIESPTFQDLLESFMPDDDLAKVHKRLLNTRKLEHMVFPLEHQDPSDIGKSLPVDEELKKKELAERPKITDNMTDVDIVDMLAEVNCKVKRIVHGEQARHVYFWAHDAKAQKDALELAYKMKGHIGKGGEAGSTVNFNFNKNEGTQTFVKTTESTK